MFAIGLTGGIASGKSAVADRFKSKGIAVIDADLAAREVVEPGQPALAEIVALFGPDVLLPDGGLDLTPYTHVRAWLERVAAQPGYIPLLARPVSEAA